MTDLPSKIVVEVLTPETVSRLEARDEDLRKEIKNLENRMDGLHRTIYELIDAIGTLRKR